MTIAEYLRYSAKLRNKTIDEMIEDIEKSSPVGGASLKELVTKMRANGDLEAL